MKIIKKIKGLLGLELPYLLEEEEAEIEIKGNILKAPENFYTSEVEKQIEQFNKAILSGGISINEAKELLNLGRK